jgi:hypothetical protein
MCDFEYVVQAVRQQACELDCQALILPSIPTVANRISDELRYVTKSLDGTGLVLLPKYLMDYPVEHNISDGFVVSAVLAFDATPVHSTELAGDSAAASLSFCFLLTTTSKIWPSSPCGIRPVK